MHGQRSKKNVISKRASCLFGILSQHHQETLSSPRDYVPPYPLSDSLRPPIASFKQPKTSPAPQYPPKGSTNVDDNLVLSSYEYPPKFISHVVLLSWIVLYYLFVCPGKHTTCLVCVVSKKRRCSQPPISHQKKVQSSVSSEVGRNWVDDFDGVCGGGSALLGRTSTRSTNPASPWPAKINFRVALRMAAKPTILSFV